MDLYQELGLNSELVVGDLYEIAFQITVLGKDFDTSGKSKSPMQKRRDVKMIEILKQELKIKYLLTYFPQELEKLAVKEVIKHKDVSTFVLILFVFVSSVLGAILQSVLYDKFGFSLLNFLQNILNP
jgi:hypothetical protein